MYYFYRLINSSIFFFLSCQILGLRASSTHEQDFNDDRLQSMAHPGYNRRIAIIGAGAAGSSAAYYLRKFANKAGLNVNITVFEKNGYIGGRVATVNVYDDIYQPTELGSTLFIDANSILKNATDNFNLNLDSIAYDDSFGVWNGHEIVFTQESDTSASWDRLKLILKYGLVPLKFENLKNRILDSFLKFYEYPIFPFSSLTNTVFDLGLNSTTSLTGAELLEKNNIKGPFLEEIIKPSARVAFGQSTDTMHGLQTLVSMAVEGAMSIKGGNQKIFQEMIKSSNCSTFLNTSVKNISPSSIKRGYNITWLENIEKSKLPIINYEHFDSVVLTTPIPFSNISLENITLKNVPKEIRYIPLHVTLFTSPHQLNPVFFNIPKDKPVPATVITTLPSIPPPAFKNGPKPPVKGAPEFISISKIRSTFNPSSQKSENLYKIFSLNAVDAILLSGLLNTTVATNLTTSPDTISWYYPYVWENAYPYSYPRDQFDEPQLTHNFWYTSGIESLVSTMETSALMGMNVARLIINDYQETINNQMQSFKYQPTRLVP